MGKETADRIQTSFLNAAESRLTIWLAKRQPAWVTSDMLTYLGLVAAIFYAFFCWMANFDVNYYWWSSLALVVNWYGDSLDGNLARVRQLQRPKYGFFIDHSVDALSTCLFCMGLGLGPLMQLSISLFIMGGYLCLSIYTYLSTIILGQFKLTYAKMGPTEMRLLIIAVCILFIYNPWSDVQVNMWGTDWSVYDFAGATVAALLFIIYIVSMIKDLRELAKIDPAKPYRKQN